MRALGVDVGAECGLMLLEFRGRRAIWLGDETTREPFASSLVVDEPDLDLIAVEGIGTVYPRARFAAPMATALKNAGHLAGEFKRYAHDRNISWRETTAREVRAAMCGRANADDWEVARIVRARVEDLPNRTSSHVRDAALAALFVATEVSFRPLPFAGRLA